MVYLELSFFSVPAITPFHDVRQTQKVRHFAVTINQHTERRLLPEHTATATTSFRSKCALDQSKV